MCVEIDPILVCRDSSHTKYLGCVSRYILQCISRYILHSAMGRDRSYTVS